MRTKFGSFVGQTVEEPVYADENTPGDCLISRPAVTDTRLRLPSRKAVVAEGVLYTGNRRKA